MRGLLINVFWVAHLGIGTNTRLISGLYDARRQWGILHVEQRGAVARVCVNTGKNKHLQAVLGVQASKVLGLNLGSAAFSQNMQVRPFEEAKRQVGMRVCRYV